MGDAKTKVEACGVSPDVVKFVKKVPPIE